MNRFFEWDTGKAEANFRKHRVRFEEAARVFGDPLSFSEMDRVENGEQRWRTIGMSGGVLLLLVAHLVREENGAEIVRIISARRADKKERRRYEHGSI